MIRRACRPVPDAGDQAVAPRQANHTRRPARVAGLPNPTTRRPPAANLNPAETLYSAINELIAHLLADNYGIADPRTPSRIGQLRVTVSYGDLAAVLAHHPQRPPGDIHPFVADALLDLPAVRLAANGRPAMAPAAIPQPGRDIRLFANLPLPPLAPPTPHAVY